MAMTPDQLKAAIPRGMLAFPLTDFDADDAFDKKSHVARLEWLCAYQPAALFMAGGAGEFFSLTPAEFSAVIAAGVETCGGKLPVIAAPATAPAPRSNMRRRRSGSAPTASCCCRPTSPRLAGGPARAYRGGLQVHAARRHRLQPRQLPAARPTRWRGSRRIART